MRWGQDTIIFFSLCSSHSSDYKMQSHTPFRYPSENKPAPQAIVGQLRSQRPLSRFSNGATSTGAESVVSVALSNGASNRSILEFILWDRQRSTPLLFEPETTATRPHKIIRFTWEQKTLKPSKCVVWGEKELKAESIHRKGEKKKREKNKER